MKTFRINRQTSEPYPAAQNSNYPGFIKNIIFNVLCSEQESSKIIPFQMNNVNTAMNCATPENGLRSILKEYMQLYLNYWWILECSRCPLCVLRIP